MSTEKLTGVDYLSNIWKGVINIKDATMISIKARNLKRTAEQHIKNIESKIDDDELLFQNNIEKNAIDSNDFSFSSFNEIQKRILLNKKELEIAKATYKSLFNEDL